MVDISPFLFGLLLVLVVDEATVSMATTDDVKDYDIIQNYLPLGDYYVNIVVYVMGSSYAMTIQL